MPASLPSLRPALLTALAFGLLGLFLFLDPSSGETGLRLFVRLTARGAVLLFVTAFAATGLRRLQASPRTEWLMAHRDALYLAFATAHFIHLGALGALAVRFPDPFVVEIEALTLVGGGLAYLFIGLAVLDLLGAFGRRRPRARQVLATVGAYYVWAIFARAYLLRALEDTYYAPFVGLLLLALLLRLYAARTPADFTPAL